MNNQSKDIFKSSNLSLVAAILSTKEAKLVGSHQITPYKVEFHLTPADVCYKLQQDYINDTLIVSVRSVEDNIKMLKSLAREDDNGF